jgi:hypothetical protein
MSRFDPLINSLPGQEARLHNVQLVHAEPGQNDATMLTVELDGERMTVLGLGKWDEYSRRHIGKHGYLHRFWHEPWAGTYGFAAYPDPSLRRAPELDMFDISEVQRDGRAQGVVGWRSDFYPSGFRAPFGLIPGEQGDFLPDETIPVTLRIPPEFIQQCREVRRTPEEVLRGFIADLAGLQSYISKPRADGYSSNGSDERTYAEQWLDRAYGTDRMSFDELAAADTAAEQIEEDSVYLLGALDDFIAYGGDRNDFMDAVDVVVTKQEAKKKGVTNA